MENAMSTNRSSAKPPEPEDFEYYMDHDGFGDAYDPWAALLKIASRLAIRLSPTDSPRNIADQAIKQLDNLLKA